MSGDSACLSWHKKFCIVTFAHTKRHQNDKHPSAIKRDSESLICPVRCCLWLCWEYQTTATVGVKSGSSRHVCKAGAPDQIRFRF